MSEQDAQVLMAAETGNSLVPYDEHHLVSPLHFMESDFLETKEYRRFVEFCEDCRTFRYIGICYGEQGVGKTQSARHYAQWERMEPLLTYHGMVQPSLSPDNPIPRTAFYTPRMTVTPKQMEQDLTLLRWSLQVIGDAAGQPLQRGGVMRGVVSAAQVNLIVVDEVDRLKSAAFEVLRDLHDRERIGLILMGMPGIEKRLARYAQLYSRVGFVHPFRSFGVEEQREVIVKQLQDLSAWRRTQLLLEQEAIAAIIRMTHGNFRMQQQLLKQIERILQINPQVDIVNREVVQAAREQLVFGR